MRPGEEAGVKQCLYDKTCQRNVVGRGLCMRHYSRARDAGELNRFPKVGHSRPPRFMERAALPVYLEQSVADRIEELAAARRARGIHYREGGSISGVVRDLIDAGLKAGVV